MKKPTDNITRRMNFKRNKLLGFVIPLLLLGALMAYGWTTSSASDAPPAPSLSLSLSTPRPRRNPPKYLGDCATGE